MNTPDPRHSCSRGFSLIEVMIAAAMLLVVTVGILPLFTRAINDNVAGRRATEATNAGRSELERLIQIAPTHPDLVVPAGEIERVTTTYFDNDKWTPTAPTTGQALFTRRVTLHFYSRSAMHDPGAENLIEPDERLASGDPNANILEIIVDVATPTQIDVSGKRVRLRVMRAI